MKGDMKKQLQDIRERLQLLQERGQPIAIRISRLDKKTGLWSHEDVENWSAETLIFKDIPFLLSIADKAETFSDLDFSEARKTAKNEGYKEGNISQYERIKSLPWYKRLFKMF